MVREAGAKAGYPPDWHLAEADLNDAAAAARYQGLRKDWGGEAGVLLPSAGSRPQALEALRLVAVQGEGVAVDDDNSHFLRLFGIWQGPLRSQRLGSDPRGAEEPASQGSCRRHPDPARAVKEVGPAVRPALCTVAPLPAPLPDRAGAALPAERRPHGSGPPAALDVRRDAPVRKDSELPTRPAAGRGGRSAARGRPVHRPAHPQPAGVGGAGALAIARAAAAGGPGLDRFDAARPAPGRRTIPRRCGRVRPALDRGGRGRDRRVGAARARHVQKAVHILEEAVRGFDIGATHGSFWREKDVAAFKSALVFDEPVIVPGDGRTRGSTR